MKVFTVYLLMDASGLYRSRDGNWTPKAKDAQLYNAEEVLLLVRALPDTSAIAASVGTPDAPTQVLCREEVAA